MNRTPLVCEYCHRTFRSERSHAKYCCNAHRQAHYRAELAKRPAAARPSTRDDIASRPWHPTAAQVKLAREVATTIGQRTDLFKLYPVLNPDGTQQLNPDGLPLWNVGQLNGKRVVYQPPAPIADQDFGINRQRAEENTAAR